MRNRPTRHLALFATCGVLAAAGVAQAQTITQTFTLVPGWNAIYLEVEPPSADPETVFQGLPVRSVWTWRARLTALQFVADANEEELRETGWLGYFPPTRAEAFISNLEAIQVDRSYLVKLGGSSPATLSVTGRPSLRRQRWQPSSFNLVGAGLTATPPTFATYFAPSPAHAGQPIYRLDPGGAWRLAAPSEAMRAGEAFWIFSAGASDYDGPFDITLPTGEALDFGSVLERVDLEITNRALAASNLTVSLLNETGGSNVLERETDSILTTDWQTLPAVTNLAAAAGATVRLQLAARRGSLTTYEALLEISDGATRRLLTVRADGVGVTTLAGRALSSTNPDAGLWVGTVTLDQVAEVHADPTTPPTATPAKLEARLILHVDDAGVVRLLKEVLQMWRDGTTTTNSSGNQVTATAGCFVQITDKTKLSEFKGATVRGNKLVGRRISTDFVDFPGLDVPGTGGWAPAPAAVTFSFTLAANAATNPFLHRYHPEHDEASESYAVTRSILVTFAATDPDAGPSGARPDWLTRRVAGEYQETLTGLHNRPLVVKGRFSLKRFSSDGVLNPTANGPCPSSGL